MDMGKELTPTQVKDDPDIVDWPVEAGGFYTLAMIGTCLFKRVCNRKFVVFDRNKRT